MGVKLNSAARQKQLDSNNYSAAFHETSTVTRPQCVHFNLPRVRMRSKSPSVALLPQVAQAAAVAASVDAEAEQGVLVGLGAPSGTGARSGGGASGRGRAGTGIWLSAPALLFGVAVWFGWLSWLRPLMLPDEGRYAGVAWDMYRSGTMAVPLLDGMPYFHKPPLYYWLAEIGYAVFGVNEWAARFPSWLAACAAVVAVYFFLRRYRDAGTARAAVLILATLPFFYGGAQFANMDMLVAGTIALATLAGAAAVLEDRAGRRYRRLMLAAGAFAALALLSKGLIGVVLPVGILLAWLVGGREWRSLRVLVWPPAIALFLALSLPWFLLMQARYSDFYHYFFIYQQFQRFSDAGFNNVQPFWFYPPVLIGLSLPWMLWGRGLFRKAFWTSPSKHDIRLLMVIWIAVVVGFFSLPSSKLIGYMVPALPPLAILLADVLRQELAAPTKAVRRAAEATLGVSVLICVLAVFVTTIYGKASIRPLVAPYISQIGADDTLVALHSYQFDLAFYTQAKKPMWVVDDWNKFGKLPDNWRKELLDASTFAPAMGQEVLVPTDKLTERLCAAPNGTFWFWGRADDVIRYPLLSNVAPLINQEKMAFWRVDTDAAFKASTCPAAG
jgi:4-amino-4-deoxy-L-arabinose transferase-like glycosyltransferase